MKTKERKESISRIILERVTLIDMESQFPILRNVDFEIPLNKNYNIISDDHSHVSSFLKFLALLSEPQEGSLQFDQINATQSQFDDIIPLRLRIGYSFDYGGLLSNRSLFQNLMLPLEYHQLLDAPKRVEKVEQMLAWFSLEDVKTKFPSEVSGKVRKLICVLRAFIHSPEILVLDDPTLGLSNEMKETLIEVLKEHQKSGEIRHIISASQDQVWLGAFVHDDLILEGSSLFMHAKGWEKVTA